MTHECELARLLAGNAECWRLLGAVRDLDLPDVWIGAGVVRNAAWDHLHGREATPPDGDVDVVYFDAGRFDPARDEQLERWLSALAPGVSWSVKNQARMHGRNNDPPYASTADAIRHWPETATAVAVRRTADDGLDVCAPFGLHDLFALLLRPTPRFAGPDRAVCEARARAKGWCARWPKLRWAEPLTSAAGGGREEPPLLT